MKTAVEQVIFDLFDGNPPSWAELIIKEGLEMEEKKLKDAYAMGREGKTIEEFNETFKTK